jgi:hypothetical protein
LLLICYYFQWEPDPVEALKHFPPWAKKVLVVVSIVGPLTGAVVTITSAYYDVRGKANDAGAKTKASYETLAPAVKELQTLLTKTQDIVDIQDDEIVKLKAARDEQDKRILRLEAYVDVLSRRRRDLPAPPPEVQPEPAPVSPDRGIRPPKAEVPRDVAGAQQMQEKL